MLSSILSQFRSHQEERKPPTVFHQSLMLVQDVEAHLVGDVANRVPILGSLQRHLWLPTKFVVIGLSSKVQALVTWTLASLVFLMMKNWIMGQVASDPLLGQGLSWVCVICPIALALFPMPSVRASTGVSSDDAEFAAQALRRRGLATKTRVVIVQQTLKVFEERCKTRLQSLTWLVNLSWAGWGYLFVKGMEAAMAGKPPTTEAFIASVALFYGVLFFYLAISSYESALSRLFRTVDVACSDIQLSEEPTISSQSI
ncbi:hypothetical protein [Roseateles sp. LKC17W]|uniref:ABC transmembrane type-1 domain-containing protein n=1 Tax=Pelomonas margarita TaxID=3299031 RepID=A0ABW7FQG1_9BURK